MNSRTLWTIIIKVLGIVLIVKFIPYLVQFITVLPLSIARPFSEFILMAGISTLTMVVYLFLLWLSFLKRHGSLIVSGWKKEWKTKK